MGEGNVRTGLKYFKENAEKLFNLEPSISSSEEILGIDIRNRVKSFWQSFFFVNMRFELTEWEGNYGAQIRFSAFFLNNEGSGYQHFKKMYPEGEKFVIGLSADIADLLEIILRIKEASDYSNPIPEDRKLKQIDDIKDDVRKFLPRAIKNLFEIVKIFWPDATMAYDKGDMCDISLPIKDGVIEDGAFLDVIRSLDLKDREIKKYLEKEKKQKDREDNLEKREVELNVSEDWHKYFEARANDENYKKELDGFIKTSKHLRTFIYTIPTISFVGIFMGLIFAWTLNFDVDVEPKFILPEIALFNLFIVSFLSYHLKQVLREIAILKHLQSSYLHRAIVAKTFQSLVASKHFQDEKNDIVVKEAALAMFKKEAQGYLSKDQMEPSNTPLQEIVGIFKKS